MNLHNETPEIRALLRTGPLEWGRIVDVFLDDETLHYWDHSHAITVDDGTGEFGPVVYQPVGSRLVAPEDVTDDQSLDGETIDIQFDSSRASDDSDFVGSFLDQRYLQRRVRIRSVLFEPGTNKTVPVWLFNVQNGVIDQVRDRIQDGEVSTLTVTIASGTFAYLERREWTFSDADQQILFPGDTGFERLAQLVDVELPWNGEF